MPSMTSAIANIAVVDDDDSVRESLRQLLRAADFDALTFASAEAYLSQRPTDRVDCLIVDVNLPGMSGVGLVHALAATGNTTPVVLITARDDAATLELVRRAGRIPLLRKPFRDDELFDAIARALSG
jgi:FixJ family two-component response regulator